MVSNSPKFSSVLEPPPVYVAERFSIVYCAPGCGGRFPGIATICAVASSVTETTLTTHPSLKVTARPTGIGFALVVPGAPKVTATPVGRRGRRAQVGFVPRHDPLQADSTQ